MASRAPSDKVKSAVEAQSAACRTLAQVIRDYGESLGFLSRSESQIIKGWASILDQIAVGLAEAVRDQDPTALARLWRFTKTASTPLVFAAGSLTTTAVGDFGHDLHQLLTGSDKVTMCANDVAMRADEQLPIILEWQPSSMATATPQPTTATGAAHDASVGVTELPELIVLQDESGNLRVTNVGSTRVTNIRFMSDAGSLALPATWPELEPGETIRIGRYTEPFHEERLHYLHVNWLDGAGTEHFTAHVLD